MITHSQVSEASFEVRLKAKKCHAFERGNEVYVIPFDPAKDSRIVMFLTEGIMCVSVDGVMCEANRKGHRACYHVMAAKRRKEINAKRRNTIAMKRAA